MGLCYVDPLYGCWDYDTGFAIYGATVRVEAKMPIKGKMFHELDDVVEIIDYYRYVPLCLRELIIVPSHTDVFDITIPECLEYIEKLKNTIPDSLKSYNDKIIDYCRQTYIDNIKPPLYYYTGGELRWGSHEFINIRLKK